MFSSSDCSDSSNEYRATQASRFTVLISGNLTSGCFTFMKGKFEADSSELRSRFYILVDCYSASLFLFWLFRPIAMSSGFLSSSRIFTLLFRILLIKLRFSNPRCSPTYNDCFLLPNDEPHASWTSRSRLYFRSKSLTDGFSA